MYTDAKGVVLKAFFVCLAVLFSIEMAHAYCSPLTWIDIPNLVTLKNGVTVGNLSANQEGDINFFFETPDNVTELDIKASGPSVNGFNPAGMEVMCADKEGDYFEDNWNGPLLLTLYNPTCSCWIIDLYATETFKGWSIKATYKPSNAPSTPDITKDWDITGVMTTKINVKGQKAKIIKGNLDEVWTVNDGGSLATEIGAGTWTIKGKTITGYWEADSIIAYFESSLGSILGGDVTIDKITSNSISLKEQKDGTIKGSFKIYMNISLDGKKGTVKISGNVNGT